jgi:hypothetical protein
VCYSSNASFRTSSDTAASIGLLLCFWQYGGAILNYDGGKMTIKGSEFKGNTASDGGNNIYEFEGEVTCNDDGNTFESSGGGQFNDPKGNYPTGLCD